MNLPDSSLIQANFLNSYTKHSQSDGSFSKSFAPNISQLPSQNFSKKYNNQSFENTKC